MSPPGFVLKLFNSSRLSFPAGGIFPFGITDRFAENYFLCFVHYFSESMRRKSRGFSAIRPSVDGTWSPVSGPAGSCKSNRLGKLGTYSFSAVSVPRCPIHSTFWACAVPVYGDLHLQIYGSHLVFVLMSFDCLSYPEVTVGKTGCQCYISKGSSAETAGNGPKNPPIFASPN